MSVRREIYISSGLKNGFYTLRSNTTGQVGDRSFSTDTYLRNLSTDPDKAEAKARAYFDRVYGNRCLDVTFAGFADFDLTPWGKALEPWERKQLMELDAGLWPFGKHKGTKVVESPDGYVMFWAQQAVAEGKRVANALIELCRSVADERGLKAKFEERRKQVEAEKAADALVSKHVGTVGQRLDLELTVRGVFQYDGNYGPVYGYIMRDTDGNIVVGKFSSRLRLEVDSNTFRDAARDSKVVMKATVKAHSERDGVLQTVVQRPKVLDVQLAG